MNGWKETKDGKDFRLGRWGEPTPSLVPERKCWILFILPRMIKFANFEFHICNQIKAPKLARRGVENKLIKQNRRAFILHAPLEWIWGKERGVGSPHSSLVRSQNKILKSNDFSNFARESGWLFASGKFILGRLTKLLHSIYFHINYAKKIFNFHHWYILWCKLFFFIKLYI